MSKPENEIAEQLVNRLVVVEAEGDSLRAELATARARVETLEAALRDIRDMDTVQQGRTVSDWDLLYQAKGRAAAAAKEGQVV